MHLESLALSVIFFFFVSDLQLPFFCRALKAQRTLLFRWRNEYSDKNILNEFSIILLITFAVYLW